MMDGRRFRVLAVFGAVLWSSVVVGAEVEGRKERVARLLGERAVAAKERLGLFNAAAMRLAIEDLKKSYPQGYDRDGRYLKRLARYEGVFEEVLAGLDGKDKGAVRRAEGMLAFQREALLGNPVVDFGEIIVIRRRFGDKARSVMSTKLGMPGLNAYTNDTIARAGWDNDIAILGGLRERGEYREVYKSEGGRPITDLDVHFDGEKVMFSSIGEQGNWRLFEVGLDGGEAEQLTPDDSADIGHFDSCYLPDGRIVFDSTATFVGLPCENGNRIMACLYLLEPESKGIRQLAFEQDSDWCPTVLNNGRVMYLRWEYTGLPHSNSRILMSMNPDGTNQSALYGSGSYFPNSFFFAKAVPGHPTKVVGIAGGHHGISRSGRMLIIDPAVGRGEADGVVHEVPHRGRKVEATVRDRLVDGVWPQFLHPYPLSEKYFLVSMKHSAKSLWGIYLVDVFDNMVLIDEVEGAALLDPIPVRVTARPPVLPDRIDPTSEKADVLLVDVYHGGGLKGIPRGSVKKLRVFSYYFSPRGVGGLLGTIGMDGPWDIKRVLGTVPVEADGSAHFEIPANTPVSVQPLDEDGKALQLMRSWFVGMRGETVSCVGCHESQSGSTPVVATIASRRAPSAIEPWYGVARNFSFEREVQPVLDKLCVDCHDGSQRADGLEIPYLAGDRMISDWSTQIAGFAHKEYGGRFSQSYAELHRYVRRAGIESDIHMLEPMEYHCDTTELVQMLRKGHYGVRLSGEQWERVYTWIDLNAPYHGYRHEIPTYETITAAVENGNEFRRRYAGLDIDYEAVPQMAAYDGGPVLARRDEGGGRVSVAAAVQVGQRLSATKTVGLGDGVEMELVMVPSGRFVMGDANGAADEGPEFVVEVETPFWMGKFEVTNGQYGCFDGEHDSRHESRHGYQFGRLGYAVNGAEQPVVRVSWEEAMAFCEWMSEKTAMSVTLASESQWEWACRAGTGSSFSFGDDDADFSGYANMGDVRLAEFAACTAADGYTRARIIENPSKYDDWIPRDTRFDDGGFVSVDVGRYRGNAWGLHDMHGNVWEWTRSDYGGYPYDGDDGRESLAVDIDKVVRGGSWYDRPKRCQSASRLSYRAYQGVFNVGFRVVCAVDEAMLVKEQ